MRYFLLTTVLAVFACPELGYGGAIVSLDLDPTTAGIQNSATFVAGSAFTVDVVISDDGQPPTPTVFDTVILQLSFNDAGAVLGAGPAGVLGGTLAGTPPGITLGVFGIPFPQASAAGASLASVPSLPAASFASSSGAAGLFDPLTFTIPSGQPPVSIFSFDFLALTPGSSTIAVTGSPVGNPILALQGNSVGAQIVGGTVTVEPNIAIVPEPRGLVLAVIGALCLVAAAMRRRTLKHIKRWETLHST